MRAKAISAFLQLFSFVYCHHFYSLKSILQMAGLAVNKYDTQHLPNICIFMKTGLMGLYFRVRIK